MGEALGPRVACSPSLRSPRCRFRSALVCVAYSMLFLLCYVYFINCSYYFVYMY